jgi:hypothetical protein
MFLLTILLIVIFVALSTIHFVWAFGIKWGEDYTLPTNEKGERIINPKRIDCIIVALGLATFALFYALRLDLLSIELPNWIFNIIGYIIPTIFTLRAIGDFKHIGFFKRLKDTKFGKADTKFYSPLCSFIGVFGFLIQVMATR